MKSNTIQWPDLTFPPINLWSMHYMNNKRDLLYSRFNDIYCSDEIAMMYKRGWPIDLKELNKAEKEFKAIWTLRRQHWENMN